MGNLVLYDTTLCDGHFVPMLLAIPMMFPRWGKFGRVCCKQSSVAAYRFQNKYNKVEIALKIVKSSFKEINVLNMSMCPSQLSSLLLSALKSWLQLILAKYDINGNYS